MGFLEDRIGESRVRDDQRGGAKADWLWGGIGNVLGIDSEGIADQFETQGNKTAATSAISRSGFSREALSEHGDLSTPDGVASAAAGLRRARDVSDQQTQFRQSLEPTRMTLQANSNQLAAQLKQSELKFNYMEARDANIRAENKAERLDDKAEARRERLDLLDRQDHRYAQEMQRYDKRRRQESIQGLVGGLAALGAAFAV
jgi:hypothetical protein